jgi:glutathionylspermidine synthase
MKRFNITPRKDWQKKVEELGFIWHTANGTPYWNEAGYYEFSLQQIEQIEAATEECHKMFIDAADYVIRNNLFSMFGIPEHFVPALVNNWNNEPPALNYGRFDFGYDGKNPPKLFEYNADTPTSLVEAAVVQWLWKDEVFPENDQFNSIHDKLIKRWLEIKHFLPKLVHFTHGDEASGEDAITTAYMMDTAYQADIDVKYMPIEQIGWYNLDNRFEDPDEVGIDAIYKLYPWEWLVNEEFGRNILKSKTLWIEPIWKMLYSNKAILPILWQLFPDSPYLLRTTTEAFPSDSFVTKPILSREGANVSLYVDGKQIAASDGLYNNYPFIYQERFSLPNFEGKYPVIGSWCINGEAAGMGIREDGLITGNTASFIPHIIV